MLDKQSVDFVKEYLQKRTPVCIEDLQEISALILISENVDDNLIC
jgi:hypothetical protein